jgi:hypothetical protein
LKKPNNKKKAEKFIKEDHSDTNMLVAIRIRPLNQKEVSNNEMDIIRSEDKLLVIFIYLNIFRSYLTKLKWNMRMKERNQKFFIDLASRGITSIEYLLKEQTLRLYI